MTPRDDETTGNSTADAHGQAAMLLTESLIHALIEKKVLSVAEAIDVVDTAAQANVAINAERGDESEHLQASLSLLEAISTSLAHDVG